MNKPKVAVLLATYNGECWISAQIDSILAQRDVDVTIYISDDCSTDKTKEICSNYSERFNNIKLLSNSERMGGASANFFRLLLSNEYDQHDFVALSDQDDIWKENKLIHAIKQIGTDGFYSSNVTAFYSDGRQVLINKSQKMTSYDYFFEGGGPGCTYVFSVANAFKLREFLVKHVNILKDITYHDWFIYAFARSNNYKWIIDPWPSMYYRQHSNNQIGANSSFGGIIKRLKMIRSKWYRKQVTLIANTLEAADSSKIQKNLNRNYYGNLLFSVNFYKLRRSYKDKIFILIFMLLYLF
ncbi:glycosyltransferase [Escherichia coli]|uniref:glycosyltransferase n=1 Tax=Escherichia coli TaxID=562 RepID=UPI003F66C6B9